MARSSKDDGTEAPNAFRFNLIGLVAFSLCLTVGTLAAAKMCFGWHATEHSFARNEIPDPDQQGEDLFTRTGRWGELLTQNIKLQRPTEYLANDAKNPAPATWTFAGLDAAKVSELLLAKGLTRQQVDSLMSRGHVAWSNGGTVITPTDDFLLSLTTEARQRLYGGLYGSNVYVYIDYPFVFPQHSIDAVYADDHVHPDDLALLKQLVYPTTNATQLTDYSLLLRKTPTLERRIALSKALSMQPAVLTRLCVRPDTDIEQVANYWGHMDNVRFNDMRPMLEALKALPQGGTVSLLYFLPPFARQRLYTFPLPDQPDAPAMDCHWSTFNFRNIEPDNRFTNTVFSVDYLKKNYYPVETASVYGDLLLLANDRNEIKHSAVYLADDLAFTKYGNNYRQPWLVARIADMQAMYPGLKVLYYRQKGN
jgi:hypothetical protein